MKEKYYINEKTHLVTEKEMYLIIPWKLINKGVLISSRGVGKKSKKLISSPVPHHPTSFIRHLRVSKLSNVVKNNIVKLDKNIIS